MLDECAAGWSWELKEHHRWIRFNAKCYRSFPRGPGRGARDFEIEAIQVRSMLRHLEIDQDCARAAIPAIAPKKKAPSGPVTKP